MTISLLAIAASIVAWRIAYVRLPHLATARLAAGVWIVVALLVFVAVLKDEIRRTNEWDATHIMQIGYTLGQSTLYLLPAVTPLFLLSRGPGARRAAGVLAVLAALLSLFFYVLFLFLGGFAIRTYSIFTIVGILIVTSIALARAAFASAR